MCFAPTISLITFIIEFAVATYLIIRYRNYFIPFFSAVFIYILGTYQLMEFLICTTSYPLFFAKLGFMIYSILPTIALWGVLRINNKKNKFIWIPLIIIFIYTLFTKDFITLATCSKMFIILKGKVYNGEHLLITLLYVGYYFIYTLTTIAYLFKTKIKEKDKSMKKIESVWIFFGIITLILPLLLIILPYFNNQFPSMYCEFSLLFTIGAIISSEIYMKKKRKEKIHLLH